MVPTAIFGCEMWILDDLSYGMIEEFQNYVGKRIERLHPRCLNACSLYGLGWMRMERIIQIRKTMFVRSIMVMQENAIPRSIFCERAKFYFSNPQFGSRNEFRSNVFDLLNTCAIFKLLDDVRNMVEKHQIYQKKCLERKSLAERTGIRKCLLEDRKTVTSKS